MLKLLNIGNKMNEADLTGMIQRKNKKGKSCKYCQKKATKHLSLRSLVLGFLFVADKEAPS